MFELLTWYGYDSNGSKLLATTYVWVYSHDHDCFLAGLKSCMRRAYAYIEGVEELLIDLKNNGYEMHTSTNYPIWFVWMNMLLWKLWEALSSSFYFWTFLLQVWNHWRKAKTIILLILDILFLHNGYLFLPRPFLACYSHYCDSNGKLNW